MTSHEQGGRWCGLFIYFFGCGPSPGKVGRPASCAADTSPPGVALRFVSNGNGEELALVTYCTEVGVLFEHCIFHFCWYTIHVIIRCTCHRFQFFTIRWIPRFLVLLARCDTNVWCQQITNAARKEVGEKALMNETDTCTYGRFINLNFNGIQIGAEIIFAQKLVSRL